MRTATPRGLHRFAVVAACCTLGLVFAGGLVTSTGSGLAVPDWPLSYGTLNPPMVGGIRYEHSHRLIAGSVALLTTALMVWAWRREPRRWVRALALVAWVTVLVQALLGGLTVLLLLPTAVSVTHGGVAQVFFTLMCLLAVVTSPRWLAARAAEPSHADVRALGIVAVACVYVQTLLGAWMRHTGAGLAIPDFPLSYGRVAPPLTSAGLDMVNTVRTRTYFLHYLDSIGPVAIHFAHRTWAVVVLAAIVALFVATVRRHRQSRVFVGLAAAAVGLVCAQALLGGLTIWTRKAAIPTTAHVALGSVILATTVVHAVIYRRCTTLELDRAAATAPVSRGAAHA